MSNGRKEMKLSHLIMKLTHLYKIHGDKMKLVYGVDDEGNAFNEVLFSPASGEYDEEYNTFSNESKKKNSICIN